MPYTFSSIPLFERSLKNFDPQQKEVVKRALRALMIYLSTNGSLTEARKTAPRFFFKQLRRPFYEIGVESKLRIVLRKEELDFVALFAGNHDQVKRFLAQH